METATVTLVEVHRETPDCRTYYFEYPQDFEWMEGGHTHIGLPGFFDGKKPNKELVHHYSISTCMSEGRIGITTRFIKPYSPFKQVLDGMKIGDKAVLFKWGARLQLRRSDRPLVLLSQGVGVAAMRPLLLTYVTDGTAIPSITNVNVHAGGQFIFKEELEGLAEQAAKQGQKLTNYFCDCRDAYATALAEQLQPEAIYYVVGSGSFIESTVKKLLAAGVTEEAIVLDKKPEERAAILGLAE